MNRSDTIRRTGRAASLGAALLLAACATPAPVAPGPGAAVEARLARLCAESIGAEVASLDDIRLQDRERAAARLGIDRSLQVIAVIAGSPADAAGLRPGDVVEAVDGAALPAGAGARQAFLVALDGRVAHPQVRVRRDGHRSDLTLRVRGGACITPAALPPRRVAA